MSNLMGRKESDQNKDGADGEKEVAVRWLGYTPTPAQLNFDKPTAVDCYNDAYIQKKKEESGISRPWLAAKNQKVVVNAVSKISNGKAPKKDALDKPKSESLNGSRTSLNTLHLDKQKTPKKSAKSPKKSAKEKPKKADDKGKKPVKKDPKPAPKGGHKSKKPAKSKAQPKKESVCSKCVIS